MTMHHSRCHWSRALYQVLVLMLMQKRTLFRFTGEKCLIGCRATT